ncbi:MAG: glycerophosphodiester phosphodiesterase [Pseudomonadota bacterium]
MRRVALVLVGLIALALAVLYLRPAPPPASHIYFEGAPQDRAEIIAHGGGLGHAPPNTLLALERAVEMGADVLEVDVQQTRDGVMILRHDDTLDRTTDRAGLIADHSWADLMSADAGARTVVNNMDYGGQGIGIPRLEDALAAFPEARWVLEIKNDTDAAAQAMCEAIRSAGAGERVLVGSFHDKSMARFRDYCPGIATSMSSGEVRVFVIAARLGLSRWTSSPAVAVQLPPSADGIDLTHPRILDAARARGLRVQYWTINDPIEMRALLAIGADGLITDFVDLGHDALNREQG